MYGNANCRADVLRADEENSDGDEIQAGLDARPAVYQRQPFSILEVRKVVTLPSSLMPSVIRVTRGRCNGDLKLQEDDQVWDRTHDRLYTITGLTRGDSAVHAGEWVIDLQRVTGGARTP